MKIGLAETPHPQFVCSGCGGYLRKVSVTSPIDFRHMGRCSLHDGFQAAILTDKERFKRYGGHVRPYSDSELTLIRDAGCYIAEGGYVRLFGGRRGLVGFEEPEWEYVGLEKTVKITGSGSTFTVEEDSSD